MTQDRQTVYFGSYLCFPGTSHDLFQSTEAMLRSFAEQTGAVVRVAHADTAPDITDRIASISRDGAAKHRGPFAEDAGREFYSWDVVAEVHVPPHAVGELPTLYDRLLQLHVIHYANS